MKLAALGVLRRGGPLSASALAERVGIRPLSLTRTLADLEEAELLTRRRDPDDAREHRLEATAKAVRLMREEGERRDRAIREVMQRVLTPLEIDLLLIAARALDKLADRWTEQTAEKNCAGTDRRLPPSSQRPRGYQVRREIAQVVDLPAVPGQRAPPTGASPIAPYNLRPSDQTRALFSRGMRGSIGSDHVS